MAAVIIDWIGARDDGVVGTVDCCWLCGLGSPGGRWVVSVVSIASVSLWSLSGSDSVVFVKLANQLVWRGAVGLLVAVSACLAVGMVDV